MFDLDDGDPMGKAIEDLAHSVAGTPWEAIPETCRAHATLALLDTVGVILAGSRQPEVAGARARARRALRCRGAHALRARRRAARTAPRRQRRRARLDAQELPRRAPAAGDPVLRRRMA
jgi:hypothetical protein